MNRRRSELQLQRGRLLERIATQRVALDGAMQPLRVALYRTDCVLAQVRAGLECIKRHPAIAGLAVAVLLAFRVRRVLRLARKSFLLWQMWQTWRIRLAGWRQRP